jgi:hypothetical protein
MDPNATPTPETLITPATTIENSLRPFTLTEAEVEILERDSSVRGWLIRWALDMPIVAALRETRQLGIVEHEGRPEWSIDGRVCPGIILACWEAVVKSSRLELTWSVDMEISGRTAAAGLREARQ